MKVIIRRIRTKAILIKSLKEHTINNLTYCLKGFTYNSNRIHFFYSNKELKNKYKDK